MGKQVNKKRGAALKPIIKATLFATPRKGTDPSKNIAKTMIPFGTGFYHRIINPDGSILLKPATESEYVAQEAILKGGHDGKLD